MKDSDRFVVQQDAHFAEADEKQFAWQTSGPGLSECEAAFLTELLNGTRPPLLEIGCGEGANLFHSTEGTSPELRIGVDRSVAKLRFAQKAVAGARFVCADATALPYATASFETVLIRDVLHHLPAPADMLAEATRVLRPGGSLVLAEPNADNPLIQLQMALVPAERGARRSNEGWLRDQFADLPVSELQVDTAIALPCRRLFLHPTFGLPSLGRRAGVRRLLDAMDDIAERFLGRKRWSYIVIRAQRSNTLPGEGPANVQV